MCRHVEEVQEGEIRCEPGIEEDAEQRSLLSGQLAWIRYIGDDDVTLTPTLLGAGNSASDSNCKSSSLFPSGSGVIEMLFS